MPSAASGSTGSEPEQPKQDKAACVRRTCGSEGSVLRKKSWCVAIGPHRIEPPFYFVRSASKAPPKRGLSCQRARQAYGCSLIPMTGRSKTSALPPAATMASRYVVGTIGSRCQTATLSRKSPHTMKCGTSLSLPTSTFAGRVRPRVRPLPAPDLVGRGKRGVKSETAALAVRHYDAGTDFFHQRVVGLLHRFVIGYPAPVSFYFGS
jgi:hypothetical protein